MLSVDDVCEQGMGKVADRPSAADRSALCCVCSKGRRGARESEREWGVGGSNSIGCAEDACARTTAGFFITKQVLARGGWEGELRRGRMTEGGAKGKIGKEGVCVCEGKNRGGKGTQAGVARRAAIHRAARPHGPPACHPGPPSPRHDHAKKKREPPKQMPLGPLLRAPAQMGRG